MASHDLNILRGLCKQYLEAVNKPIQNKRRAIWRSHNSLKDIAPPIFVRYGIWDAWCRLDTFPDSVMQCEDPFYREFERQIKMMLFQDRIGDDTILEPWLTLYASLEPMPGGWWGMWAEGRQPEQQGGARAFSHPLQDWDDMDKLKFGQYRVDENATQRDLDKIRQAIGDLIEIDLVYPIPHYGTDGLSQILMMLRGLEQMMIDMHESPRQLHSLCAFISRNLNSLYDELEAKGYFSPTSVYNQEEEYCEELTDPAPNAHGKKRKEIWGYGAAQECTSISPAMQDEFIMQYEKPLLSRFGLVAYGCCEDLTRKIDLLTKIPNLRAIAVTPSANVARCAEQIGPRFVSSYRPNPTDMVCCGFDESKIRRILKSDLTVFRANHCRVHVNLKDISTLQKQDDRLARWVKITREVIEEVWK